MDDGHAQIARRVVRNARELLEALGTVQEDDAADEDAFRAMADQLAGEIDSSWGSLVLLASWNTLQGEIEPLRPHLKSAIQRLRSRSTQGSSRSLAALASLVSACRLTHESTSASLAPIWASSASDGFVSIEIRGSNLPTTIDAQSLVNDLTSSLGAIADVMSNDVEPSSVFSSERFPHLARLPAGGEAQPIWESLYLRLALIFRLASGGLELTPVSERLSTQIYSATGRSFAFGSPSITSSLINPDEDVTAFPTVEYAGACWTSAYLLADSIAPWLLVAVQRTTLREAVISQPFEDRVVALLRAHDFEAGSVDDRGTWHTQSRVQRLRAQGTLPGQVDVLAVRDDALFVIECKSIFPMGSIRNIAEKLGPDTQDWRTKLDRKRTWVEQALRRRVDLAVVVVEGVTIYSSESEIDADIPLLTFEVFSAILNAAR